jgi:hypothetical protein
MKIHQLFLTFFVTLSFGILSAQISTNGLIRYYPLNGNANDYSGNEQNGTIYGAVSDTDRFGNINSAYNFNRFIHSHIGIPASGLDLDQFSYSVWALMNSAPADNERFCVLAVGSWSGDHAITYNVNFAFKDTLYNGWGSHSYSGGSSNTIYKGVFASNKQWYHLTETRSLTASKFYINGVLVDSVMTTDSAFYGIGPVEACIGMRYDYTLPFDGKIDDLRIYNRAITEDEIAVLYNEGLCYQTISVTVTDILLININPTKLNPLEFENTIKIYPNPAKDRITINYGRYETMTGYKLKIYNSLGQTLFSEMIDHQESVVNLSEWTGKGIYFVHIIDANESITDIKKIILQ